MTDLNHAAPCGIYCGECECLGDQCTGCGKVAGKPFWVSSMPDKVCPLHSCCRGTKGLEHCGTCDHLPCKAFLDLRDPNLTDEEFRDGLKKRQANLSRRAEVGTHKWLREMECSQTQRNDA